MKTAEQMIEKRAFIKKEMDKNLPKEQSDALWAEATGRLEKILDKYSTIPNGVRLHTDRSIFPASAIYLTLKEAIGSDTAYHIIENAAISLTEPIGRKLATLMKIPGMRSLFMHIWDPMTKKLFGPENGFQNVFYPKKKNEFRMDVTACPYCRYFAELGCPELTKIYCENDDRTYGNLPGLKFERTGTLGKGAERCDFCIRKL
ncbi:MAG: L-2-amino-thiazoline-4-carboxylic acid hydrolase [Anaerolineaceae bacterium]|nr:L-2-amino-thiazoline-4-carboxylic acid hydrolase [Anaerolineaceae bacterium]